VISIIGVLHGPEELEIRSVFRLEAETAVPNGRALDMRAELVGADGQVVARGIVYSVRSQGNCGCGGHDDDPDAYPRLVQAFVPDAEPGTELRIRRGAERLWSRSAPARRPKIGDASAELRDDELQLRWSLESSGEDEPECWAQWTTDRGRTWRALGVGLTGGSAVLDARGLPSGRVAIRLLASDGFHTATSRMLSVTVPRRPVEVAVLSPREGQTFVADSPMRLWGTATDASHGTVADDGAQWTLDGEAVASGFDAFVAAPPPGEHKATLRVKSRDGEVERAVAFTTVELSEERDVD
jgi:hypothetical protein